MKNKQLQYKVTKYPDGSQYVTILEYNPLLTYRINSYEDLWTLAQIREVLTRNDYNVTLTIPCLFDAQADRRFNNNESYGLKMICNFINSLDFDDVIIFHPHNPEVVEALIDRVHIYDNFFYVQDVLNLIPNYDSFSTVLMSTDAGGYKSVMKLADKLKFDGEVYCASKSRVWDGTTSKLTQVIDKDNFCGRDVIIIDDLCVYGGTFKGLAKILKEKNVGRLFLIVSHMTVQEVDNELLNSFDCIYTSNSKFDKYYYKGTLPNLDIIKEKLKVIELW